MVNKYHRVKNLKMRADALKIHPSAQRAVNQSHVNYISKNLNLDAVSTIHAVDYLINGKRGPWVVDGQHRLLALIAAECGEWMVDVAIHVDIKNDQQASRLFLHLNKKLNLKAAVLFEQECLSGESTATAITDVLRVHGLKFSQVTANGAVASPVSLKKAYRHDEGHSLNRALGWLTGAFGKSSNAVEGKLIEGAALVASKNNGNIDDKLMVTKLAKFKGGAPGIIGDARGRTQYVPGPLSRAVAQIIVDTYNKGKRGEKIAI